MTLNAGSRMTLADNIDSAAITGAGRYVIRMFSNISFSFIGDPGVQAPPKVDVNISGGNGQPLTIELLKEVIFTDVPTDTAGSYGFALIGAAEGNTTSALEPHTGTMTWNDSMNTGSGNLRVDNFGELTRSDIFAFWSSSTAPAIQGTMKLSAGTRMTTGDIAAKAVTGTGSYVIRMIRGGGNFIGNAGTQALATALAKIAAYADGGSDVPTLQDYAYARVSGVTAGNLTAVNLSVAAVAGTAADTSAELQALVDRIIAKATALAKIAAYADDNTLDAPTVQDYATADVTGVTEARLAAVTVVVAAVAGTAADTSAEIQVLVDRITATLVKIAAYADDNTLDAPTVQDYANAGVTGVTRGNLAAVNTRVAAGAGTAANESAEIQMIVDVDAKKIDVVISGGSGQPLIIELPRDVVFHNVDTNLTNYGFVLIGAAQGNTVWTNAAHVGTMGWNGAATDSPNGVIGTFTSGDYTRSDISAVWAPSPATSSTMTLNAGRRMTVAGFGLDGNIAAEVVTGAGRYIIRMFDNDRRFIGDPGVQAFSATAATALAKISAYADSTSNPAPTLQDYADAGVSGVTAANLAAVNTRVAAVAGTAANETAEIQRIVDVDVKKIDVVISGGSGQPLTIDLPRDVTFHNVDTDVSLYGFVLIDAAKGNTVGSFAAHSGTMGWNGTATDSSDGSINFANLGDQTREDIAVSWSGSELLRTTSTMTLNAGSRMTVAAFGLDGNIAAEVVTGTGRYIIRMIRSSDRRFIGDSGVQIFSAAAATALAKISAYADSTSNPAPTLQDYADAGVSGVTAGNLADVNAAVAAESGMDADETAEIQALVDALSTTPATPTTATEITFVDFNSATQQVTLRWRDTGDSYRIQASNDLDWGTSTEIDDGTENDLGDEIEYQFTDTDATGATRFWRVVSE